MEVLSRDAFSSAPPCMRRRVVAACPGVIALSALPASAAFVTFCGLRRTRFVGFRGAARLRFLFAAILRSARSRRLLPQMLPRMQFSPVFARSAVLPLSSLILMWLPGPDSNQRPTG